MRVLEMQAAAVREPEATAPANYRDIELEVGYRRQVDHSHVGEVK